MAHELYKQYSGHVSVFFLVMCHLIQFWFKAVHSKEQGVVL